MKIRSLMIMGLIIYAVPSLGMQCKEGFLFDKTGCMINPQTGLNFRFQGSGSAAGGSSLEKANQILREQELIRQKKIKREQREKETMEQLDRLDRMRMSRLVNHYEEHKAARKARKFLHRLHFCPKIKLLEWKK